MDTISQFVKDNRDTVSCLGGGAVVIAGGTWTVQNSFLKVRNSGRELLGAGWLFTPRHHSLNC